MEEFLGDVGGSFPSRPVAAKEFRSTQAHMYILDITSKSDRGHRASTFFPRLNIRYHN